MSTVTRDRVRRGLPRVPGGEPWPPAAEDAAARVAEVAVAEVPVAELTVAEVPVAELTVARPLIAQTTVAAPLDVPPVPESQDSYSSPHPPRDAAQRMQETGAVAPSAAAPASGGAQATVRRGLPRMPGGQPWPPVTEGGDAPVAEQSVAQPLHLPQVPAPQPAHSSPQPLREDTQRVQETVAAVAVPSAAAAAPRQAQHAVRRGLPRVAGGEPWPPAGFAPALADTAVTAAADTTVTDTTVTDTTVTDAAVTAPAVSRTPIAEHPVAATRAPEPVEASTPALRPVPEPAPRTGETALRRGLPRVAGGEPWPPAGLAPTVGAVPAAALRGAEPPGPEAPEPVEAPPAAARQRQAATPPDLSAPLPFPQTVFPGAAASEWNSARRRASSVAAKPEPKRYGPFTTLQWAGAVIVGGFGLLIAAAFAVLAVRWLVSLEFMREFLAAYPGQYELPEAAPVGIPTWLAWQHFFNAFLIVLIIRTGITVHNEKRPSAFWSPRNNKKRKISLTLWFHQSLDILWLVNGVAYVVLLFATAQWMRIVPTSWEVFPNALSAGLQYVSLVWPTENGWVNYNSLQQLAYFATVFIAAPLATITGVRMSGVWPKNAETLNRLYPVEWARKVHFPVMVYFVAFIIVHVALVLATNALRNLNHMYGGQDAVNWTGLWIFLASMVVIAAGWVAARPLVLAPIARLFGTVSGR